MINIKKDNFLKMKTHLIKVPYYKGKRRVRVLLPRGYSVDQDQSYPVLYLHDGQNAFFNRESYSGYSWRIFDLIKERTDLPKFIVVAIDNAGTRRLDEYGPWQSGHPMDLSKEKVWGDGISYGRWLVEDIKPFIDKTYRTKVDRHNTILAGSSMGGLITAYMGADYPHIFGHLGVFSLASWFSESQLLDLVERQTIYEGNKVYIQVGTNEVDESDKDFLDPDTNPSQAYVNCSINYYEALIKAGMDVDQIWLRILVDQTHHEYYWAKHFPEFLDFVFGME